MPKIDDFLAVGVVVRAHGINGELVIKLLTDDPDQFTLIKEVYFNREGERKKYTLQNVRLIRDRIILKLESIINRNQAEEMKGALIERHRSELRELAEDEYFVHDLAGLQVYEEQGVFIGELVNVLSLPANDVYVISNGGQETLIPAVKEIILKIDLVKREMIIRPIDGLLD